YVAKPIQARELCQAIEEAMANGTASVASAPGGGGPDGGGDYPPEVFNRPVALAALGGNLPLLKHVAGLFFETYPRLLADVRDAVARRDAQRLKHAAHTIKGASSNFRAARTVEAALKLERMGE